VRLLALRYLALAAAVVVLNFLLPRLLPGDPLQPSVGDGFAAATAPLSLDQQARLRSRYRLDQPLGAQFVGYIADLAHGDLGWSISRAAPVGQLMAERLPWTLALVGTSVLGAALGGSALGLVAAWRGGRWDALLVTLATALAALPEFLVALLLLVVLAVWAGWFPLQGGQTPFPAPAGWWVTLGDRVWHLALPGATLLLANLAAFMLLTRGAVRDVRAAPYLATARGKGLAERQVALRHAAPNALLPLLTLFGVRLGQVLGGAIVVERVFSVPGLGLFAFQAIQARDYPVLQAVFLLASLAVLLANFAVELAYRRLAPRGAV
jgi:peptide/nickel transport system permease protein